jgi:hypothetical protein
VQSCDRRGSRSSQGGGRGCLRPARGVTTTGRARREAIVGVTDRPVTTGGRLAGASKADGRADRLIRKGHRSGH